MQDGDLTLSPPGRCEMQDGRLECAGKTGKEERVQVPHNKEVAIHVVPESCVARREVRGEALTGVRTGQP